MNLKFSLKMAWNNIQSNKQIYLPYTLAAIITVAMFQMMSSLMNHPYVIERSSLLVQLFGLGTVVVGLFSLIFIFYTNSFLMKRRKKELGLYNVLGLEKKHVRRILWMESALTGSVSILAGLLVGYLFGQLSFLFLNYLIGLSFTMDYNFSIESAGLTVLLFVVIFFLTFVYNALQVTLANPIKLLKGAKEGEKEPKSSPLLFLIGLISLGAGYVISLRIEDPISAILQFFLAVLLVIIGTYFLFTAGSIIILKMMKKNRKFYYQPGPFISVSGMLYRMKQHATGLANITILSTMVLVAVSTTVTLFIGTEETLSNRFPEENNVNILTHSGMTGADVSADIDALRDYINDLTIDQGFEVDELVQYKYLSLYGEIGENEFERKESGSRTELPQLLLMLPLEDFNHATGQAETLADDEIFVYTAGFEQEMDAFTLGNKSYRTKKLEFLPIVLGADVTLVDTLVVVVPDARIVDELAHFYNPTNNEYVGNWEGNVFWSTTASEEENQAYGQVLSNDLNDHGLDIGVFYESRSLNREEWYSMNGGFLFLGLYLGGLFTIGAALITYFKQVSEGYDDRERIQIMQKVGLDKETTQKATQQQIIWMFTLPILVAGMHIAFAFPILQNMLILFGITSPMLLLSVIAGVLVGFAAIYWIIYRITSIVYLNIVE